MNEIEVWQDAVGTNGRYQVSNIGRVRSVSCQIMRRSGRPYTVAGKTLSQHPDKKGYLRLPTRGQGTFKVHRMVAETFIPNPLNLPEVNHIDGDKQNNHVKNLEWINHADNCRHARQIGKYRRPPQKLSNKAVAEIRDRYTPYCRKNGTNALAQEYGVSAPYVWRIVTGGKRLEVERDG